MSKTALWTDNIFFRLQAPLRKPQIPKLPLPKVKVLEPPPVHRPIGLYKTRLETVDIMRVEYLTLHSRPCCLCGVTVERSLATQKVAGSNLVRSASRPQPWASCSHACASINKQYNLVPTDGRWRSSAGKVTAGLAESNSSLPPGGWPKVTWHRDQLPAQRYVKSIGELYHFLPLHSTPV